MQFQPSTPDAENSAPQNINLQGDDSAGSAERRHALSFLAIESNETTHWARIYHDRMQEFNISVEEVEAARQQISEEKAATERKWAIERITAAAKDNPNLLDLYADDIKKYNITTIEIVPEV